ncbi:hypothetical protein PPERSA_10820 [Pseudocohnilembus persalinus]|uniref:Uncharacterized protein n=1 Tax=Pseudocohnilembus persalinus TaxID=266149 RepID=A0A0V0QDQ1_PSEPJ|nr:hypothetical protein PPERSA_10820 [Pseudocohnilembus persalinus]|eukprot:KRX00321.1 hypothetical protein PPERSA_10820 [Pseudocohnilembus persalinus]
MKQINRQNLLDYLQNGSNYKPFSKYNLSQQNDLYDDDFGQKQDQNFTQNQEQYQQNDRNIFTQTINDKNYLNTYYSQQYENKCKTSNISLQNQIYSVQKYDGNQNEQKNNLVDYRSQFVPFKQERSKIGFLLKDYQQQVIQDKRQYHQNQKTEFQTFHDKNRQYWTQTQPSPSNQKKSKKPFEKNENNQIDENKNIQQNSARIGTEIQKQLKQKIIQKRIKSLEAEVSIDNLGKNQKGQIKKKGKKLTSRENTNNQKILNQDVKQLGQNFSTQISYEEKKKDYYTLTNQNNFNQVQMSDRQKASSNFTNESQNIERYEKFNIQKNDKMTLNRHSHLQDKNYYNKNIKQQNILTNRSEGSKCGGYITSLKILSQQGENKNNIQPFSSQVQSPSEKFKPKQLYQQQFQYKINKEVEVDQEYNRNSRQKTQLSDILNESGNQKQFLQREEQDQNQNAVNYQSLRARKSFTYKPQLNLVIKNSQNQTQKNSQQVSPIEKKPDQNYNQNTLQAENSNNHILIQSQQSIENSDSNQDYLQLQQKQMQTSRYLLQQTQNSNYQIKNQNQISKTSLDDQKWESIPSISQSKDNQKLKKKQLKLDLSQQFSNQGENQDNLVDEQQYQQQQSYDSFEEQQNLLQLQYYLIEQQKQIDAAEREKLLRNSKSYQKLQKVRKKQKNGLIQSKYGYIQMQKDSKNNKNYSQVNLEPFGKQTYYKKNNNNSGIPPLGLYNPNHKIIYKKGFQATLKSSNNMQQVHEKLFNSHKNNYNNPKALVSEIKQMIRAMNNIFNTNEYENIKENVSQEQQKSMGNQLHPMGNLQKKLVINDDYNLSQVAEQLQDQVKHYKNQLHFRNQNLV